MEQDVKQIEKASINSEDKYHALFRNMLNGCALHEIICYDTLVQKRYLVKNFDIKKVLLMGDRKVIRQNEFPKTKGGLTHGTMFDLIQSTNSCI